MIINMVGNRLKDRRKALRVTQAQLSELAGVSVNTLYKIEKGQANPSLNILINIADILGLEVCLQVKKLQPSSDKSE